jgi:trans-2,3-dihydro-3-hydroxyanthranilate isomerase
MLKSRNGEPMPERKYQIYDVFTDEALAGNPLAIVHDCEGLDTAAMQKIAREFNLSETVFVAPPARKPHAAAIRIFTPNFEMPFAGHPTVGTAVSLAELNRIDDGGTTILVLEEKIGDVRCVVSRNGPNIFAEFDLPQLSQKQTLNAEPDAVGAALGLGPHEIGFENHRVSAWFAGVPYVMVPVRGLDAAARASLDPRAWREIAPDRGNGVPASAYVYCRETVHHDSAFHARMFTGGAQTYEDPATGSALAAFSGTVLEFDRPPDGDYRVWVEQGVEMGRPSRLRLEIEVEAGMPKTARIGGHAVKTAEGVLFA